MAEEFYFSDTIADNIRDALRQVMRLALVSSVCIGRWAV